MKKNYVHHTPYLKNHLSYDGNLWYTFVKWWYLQMLFFIFYKILFSGLLRSIKREKMAQNDKILSIMLHISGTIHYMIVIYGRHVQNDDISRHFFFQFFKILIFWVVSRVKGQKMTWNDKKFNPLCSIFQEPYIIWLSFLGLFVG